MTKKIIEFIKWIYKNEIVIKDDDNYINALYGEFLIEYKK